MTEEIFESIIADVSDLYGPLFESYSAQCAINGDCESTIVNAYAMRSSGQWVIALY